MKTKFTQIIVPFLVLFIVACGRDTKANKNEKSNTANTEESYEQKVEKLEQKRAEAEKATQQLCHKFPKELILKNNPDGKRIEVEPTELIPGKLDHCKIKLYYGDRDYDFWEGRVSAWVPNMPNPLSQYDPNRNSALYQKVEGFGKKAVFISNTNQLLIIKDGLVYGLVPPNTGRITSTGMENKAIVLQMAEHYNLKN